MLRTIFVGLGVWTVVSVPVALLIGRVIAVGAEGDQLRLAPVKDTNARLHQRVA